MQERMMQNGDAVSVQKLFEEPVILSGLLSGTGRIFGDPEPDHAWLHDEAFMRIVYAAMPAVYERYRDPENRAKGEPDLTAKDAIKHLELAAYEAIEVLDEWKKHREGKGDPRAILHELEDMTLTGMFAAACWDDMERKLAAEQPDAQSRGDKLRKARVSKRLTLSQVATQMLCAPIVVSDIENGKIDISDDIEAAYLEAVNSWRKS